jgi:hypothetical protein
VSLKYVVCDWLDGRAVRMCEGWQIWLVAMDAGLRIRRTAGCARPDTAAFGFSKVCFMLSTILAILNTH